jgi:hypothetical protein
MVSVFQFSNSQEGILKEASAPRVEGTKPAEFQLWVKWGWKESKL